LGFWIIVNGFPIIFHRLPHPYYLSTVLCLGFAHDVNAKLRLDELTYQSRCHKGPSSSITVRVMREFKCLRDHVILINTLKCSVCADIRKDGMPGKILRGKKGEPRNILFLAHHKLNAWNMLVLTM